MNPCEVDAGYLKHLIGSRRQSWAGLQRRSAASAFEKLANTR
jgi:hypothetical protein